MKGPAYKFLGLYSDKTSDGKGAEYTDIKIVRKVLRCGDYSILGHEHRVTVERKTVVDFIASSLNNHEWFDGKLKNMSEYTYSAVVVEGTLQEALALTQNSKSLYRAVLVWTFRYPSVHWWFMQNRRDAEICTFRILMQYWRCYVTAETSLYYSAMEE